MGLFVYQSCCITQENSKRA